MKTVVNKRRGALSVPAKADVLLASAAELETGYDLTHGSPVERLFYVEALAAGHEHYFGARWPCEGELEDIGTLLGRADGCGVYQLPNGGPIVYLHLHDGWFRITVASATAEVAHETIAAFNAKYPPLYRDAGGDGNVVPITFWMDSRWGPQSRLRMVEAASWPDIERNYTAEVRDQLAGMMHGFEPGKSGQLVLWQGPPGTGKTWALRALASEWRAWAEFSYITDPDAFFVTQPSYMIDVLLHDSYEELAVLEPDGDPELVTSNMEGGKWRVLILEDTGELLAANSKEQYGQGLSRLLNVVDGLVGQGLRILVLVTTNDELGELHPAVKRPGRCAAAIEFAPLTADEASAWLGETVDEGGTVAELYARGAGGQPPGLQGEPGVEGHLDPTGIDPNEAEADVDSPEALEAVLAFARAPLTDVPHVGPAAPEGPSESPLGASGLGLDLGATLRELAASGQLAESSAVAAALQAVADTHNRSIDAITEVLTAAATREGTPTVKSDVLALAAIEALRQFAARPEPVPAAAPDIHVHTPKHDLSVHVDAPTIEPTFHIEAPAAPPPADVHVDVHVPEQPPAEVHVAAAPAPEVTVNVPEQAAPNVTVNVPPPARPSAVRVEIGEDGHRRYVAEE